MCVTDGKCDTKTKPPTREDLEKEKDLLVSHCKDPKHGKCKPCEAPEPQDEARTHALIDMNRSANRGAE